MVPRGFQSRTTVIAGQAETQLLPPPSSVLTDRSRDSRGRALGKSAVAVPTFCLGTSTNLEDYYGPLP